jgi:hypothetical protein
MHYSEYLRRPTPIRAIDINNLVSIWVKLQGLIHPPRPARQALSLVIARCFSRREKGVKMPPFLTDPFPVKWGKHDYMLTPLSLLN